MFYELNVGNSPEFLCDLIPPSVGETNNYNLRNSHNISQTTNRLSISQQSFFPSTTKLWNKERYKIFLCASNLLQYNKKCSAFSVEYPQEQDGL
jgi:hypothetical protein